MNPDSDFPLQARPDGLLDRVRPGGSPDRPSLFLTGPPGAGKTTLLFRALSETGLVPGGFCVKRVYRRGLLEGMDMFDLATRSRARMLDFQRDGPIERGIMVHREAFIRIGAPSLAAAIDRAGIIVMDELGRFECDVPEFMSCVFAALDSSKPVIGVLKDESNPFLDAIRARHDVQVVRLERDSRDQVGIEFRSLLQRLSRR